MLVGVLVDEYVEELCPIWWEVGGVVEHLLDV